MAQINPNASILIHDYIENLPAFSKEICKLLQELIHQSSSNIVEDWKWKIPIFCFENEMICGFAAFKNHVSLTFFKGAQMSNKHQIFSEDCSAQKTRTIKFISISEIDKKKLNDYFKEAILMKKSPVGKFAKKATFEIPELLQEALNKNLLAKKNFENMAYTYRKEYALYILEAKQETTKLKRLEKIIGNLEKNIKMHEQYKC
jgi:uncharacterized protein YdeI (YjbR/CyaY-like superfamily)